MSNEEKRINKVHAPYNFVPFSNSILFPYDTADDLPSHGEWDATRKTGEIEIRMKAETPVFVSDGDKDNPSFFRTPAGKLALPGSTIRGMVRENMQILGFGLVREEDVGDTQIFFREIAAGKGSAARRLKEYYDIAMGLKPQEDETKAELETASTQRGVRAGYLRKEGERYRIIPTQGQPLGAYFRISRKDELAQPFRNKYTQSMEVFYREHGGTVTALRWAQGDCPKGMKHGFLLLTGKAVNINSIYLFPDPAPAAKGIPLKEKDVIAYDEDWERRKNVLKPAEFWELPKKDGAEGQKPVFYLEDGEHVYWGMTRFLRIGHRYPLSYGLPKGQKKAAEAAEKDGRLDYPRAILGYAEDKKAYRSRVSFGDLEFDTGTAEEGEPVPMVLGEPKPSFYPGYAYGKNNTNAVRHYSDGDFQLRGYKLYWLKREAKSPGGGKQSVTTTLRPLSKGATFRGVIRFKNLTEAELGLLLWSLRLDDNCFQSVGMGKPYGYGRMTLTIERMAEYDPDSSYDGSLSPTWKEIDEETMKQYIRIYDDAACKALAEATNGNPKRSIRAYSEIQDFFYMKQTLHEADAATRAGVFLHEPG
ncbi:MAG: TIGR03986 family CRISPR-associated RAMP protein [Clostridiales bacterium]|nr:TIGR03986 family CRISPR-associated RAMP protein [Clostridiales bacterium]MCC8098984.1 TIGR03986 family CRISPR-associated RAMP protein [Clostridiales bacterium]